MSAPIDAQWSEHFVAYEDALTSFYSLQDETERTLELEVRRRLRVRAAVDRTLWRFASVRR